MVAFVTAACVLPLRSKMYLIFFSKFPSIQNPFNIQFYRDAQNPVYPIPGCDNSRFLVVPDWYVTGCYRVLALVQTQYSMCT
jgi:quinol-cytochrome oxidoreductase complex cytochrome b subunit